MGKREKVNSVENLLSIANYIHMLFVVIINDYLFALIYYIIILPYGK